MLTPPYVIFRRAFLRSYTKPHINFSHIATIWLWHFVLYAGWSTVSSTSALCHSEQSYTGDQKPLCTWWLQYRELQVMFKVSPATLQTFIDTPNCVLEDRVRYSTVHIPNVFCDGHLQIINCVGIVIVRCTKTFRSPCITIQALYV